MEQEKDCEYVKMDQMGFGRKLLQTVIEDLGKGRV